MNRNDLDGMKVALVSDTHGYLDERVAEAVAGCALAVHAGDVGSGAVLDALERVCGRVVAVRGNNDVPRKWPAWETGRLKTLPRLERLSLPGGELVVVHGDAYPAVRRHKRLRASFPQARAVVYGHSHRLVCDTDADPWILNPGASGRARTYGGPSCLILQAGPDGWHAAERRFRQLRRRR